MRWSVEGREEVRAQPGRSTRDPPGSPSDHSDYSPDRGGQLCASMASLERKLASKHGLLLFRGAVLVCLSEYALLLFCPIVLKPRLPGSILVVCHFVLVILGHSGVLE